MPRIAVSTSLARWWPALAASLIWTWPAAAREVPVDERFVASAADRWDRMTVPVRVNGQGPFAFVVDTGADRSVVSDRLAATLGLAAGRAATLHSVTGQHRVATVAVDRMEVGSHRAQGLAPALLAEADLGAPGMLGIDMLKGQRVTLDFAARSLRIEPGARRFAPPARDEEEVIVVRGQRRYGQLILTDARISGIRVKVIIDTGAQSSIGNARLRRRLGRQEAAPPVIIESVTGEAVPAESVMLPLIEIGGATVRHLPVAFADVHAFRRFGLDDTPAMLLGMDVLGLMRRVSIDFSSRSVRFALGESDGSEPPR